MAYKRAQKPVGVLRVGWLGIGTRGQSVDKELFVVVLVFVGVLLVIKFIEGSVKRIVLGKSDIDDFVEATNRRLLPEKGSPKDSKPKGGKEDGIWTSHFEEILDSDEWQKPEAKKEDVAQRVRDKIAENLKKKSVLEKGILDLVGMSDPAMKDAFQKEVLNRTNPGCNCHRCQALRAYADALNKAEKSGNPFQTGFMSGDFNSEGLIPSVIGQHGPGKMLVTLYQGPLDGKQIWWPDPLKDKAAQEESEFAESLGVKFEEQGGRQIGGCVVIGSLNSAPEVYEICQDRKMEDDPKLGQYPSVNAKHVGRMGTERVKQFMESQGMPPMDFPGQEGGDV